MANDTSAVEREGVAAEGAKTPADATPKKKGAENAEQAAVGAQIASGAGVPAGWEYSPYAATPVRKSKG